MKAVRILKPFDLSVAEVPKPEIRGDSDVLVRVTSGGICGSDMGIWYGTNSLATYPRLVGHEFGGVVEAVGAGASSVKPGDRVAVDPVVSCGHCYACRIGRHNVCSTVEVMGVHRDGGFAEYVVAPEANIHRFHSDFDLSLLGLAEPYTIGVEINRRGQIAQGDKLLIMGSGPIGICAMQVAKGRGASVIMSDVVPERLARAQDMGADETVLIGRDDLEARLAAFTDGEGIPVVLDTACTVKSFAQATELACPAGRVICIGLLSAPSEISMANITKKELSILGSRLNNYCFDEVIAGFEGGTLTPQKLKTHEFDFRDAESAFQLIREHPEQVLKVVLNFN